jgi:hypothetical protein
MLAREPAATSQAPTIQIGKTSIEVSGGNIDAWAGGDVPDFLQVNSHKGPHSGELERLFHDKARTTLTLTVAPPNKGGQQLDLGSLAIQITNAHIKGYHVDGDAESWQVADFDGVHRTHTTHNVGTKN